MPHQDVIENSMQTPAGELRVMGGLANALEGRMSDYSPEEVTALDSEFKDAKGNLAACVEKTGKGPLAVARDWVEVGRISADDPRFSAAFDASLERRNPDFEKNYTDPERMHEFAGQVSAVLRKSGHRDEFIQMRAIETSAKDGKLNAGAFAAKLEDVAMRGVLSEDQTKSVLGESVRYAKAGTLQKMQEKTRGSRAQDEQR